MVAAFAPYIGRVLTAQMVAEAKAAVITYMLGVTPEKCFSCPAAKDDSDEPV
jgi:hypothetical protein